MNSQNEETACSHSRWERASYMHDDTQIIWYIAFCRSCGYSTESFRSSAQRESHKEMPQMDGQESRQWNWMVGRKFSLGEVVDVLGESATVRHGDDETRVLLCELLEEDYKAQGRANRALNEALNSGDGAYRP